MANQTALIALNRRNIREWTLEEKINQNPIYLWQLMHLDGTLPEGFEAFDLEDIVGYERLGTTRLLHFTFPNRVELFQRFKFQRRDFITEKVEFQNGGRNVFSRVHARNQDAKPSGLFFYKK